MKENHFYVCEICKREYQKKQDALECEGSHIRPTEIIEYFYNAFGSYPNDIRVEMEDGVVLCYKL